jgi:tetratricopeptide (TPR) repeat protein
MTTSHSPNDPSNESTLGTNVIHVAFGQGGGRLQSTPSKADAMPPGALAPTPSIGGGTFAGGAIGGATKAQIAGTTFAGTAPSQATGFLSKGGQSKGGPGKGDSEALAPGQAPQLEAAMDVFLPSEVERLLGISRAKLRTLEKHEVVLPSGLRSGKKAYTFTDLIALRATAELLKQQVKMRDVAQAITALRKTLPRVIRPLQELRIVSDGTRVVVRTDDASFEPVTGQLVFDFRVERLEQEVVRMLRPEIARHRERTAYDLYLRASRLDEHPDTLVEAEALYRKAIELDPSLAIAHTNLGNLRFRQGDETGAEALYRVAVKLDERQAEANYNLGYLMLERNQIDDAIFFLERATTFDPQFADAHFNLAMAYESASMGPKAQAHWRRYLDLDPKGAFSEIAERHLLLGR